MSSPTLSPAVDRSVHAATLGQMVLSATERHTGPAVRFRDADGWTTWTYADLGRRVRAAARGLIHLGIEPGDRVAIIGATRPEWTLADAAILAAGATVVPIYQTNSPEECQYVLEHSGARAVLCEDAEQLTKIRGIEHRLADLEIVLPFAALDEISASATEADAVALASRSAAVTPDDVATMVYTSGTTGPPKGCVLTHRSLLATMDMYEQRLALPPDAVVFLFLPLAHVLARLTQLLALDVGVTLTYWSRDPQRLLDDIAAANPTHVPTVPRVFEKIHTRALAGVEDAGGMKARMFGWATGVGRRMRDAEAHGGPGRLLALEHRLADRLVLTKVRALFGDRLQMALTGAAPIAHDVLDFFADCGVEIMEGYGLTESCAAATLNVPAAARLGSVGRPLPGVEVRIDADGEILLRGPNVFSGYHHDADATDETIDADGWLHTGDLGSVDDDGFLTITGRKKDLIITSSGKNITPTNLEVELRESRWISQAVVHGDQRPYLVAVLTLDPEEAPALAAELGIQPDLASMATDPAVLARLAEDVDAVNRRFARIEQIKRFAVLDHDLSQARGELTPTLKVKRATVYERYHDVFEGLYS